MTRPFSRFVAVALSLLLAELGASAEPAAPWQETGEKDGVRSSRSLDGDGRPVSRAEVEIPADLFEILAVLDDAPRRVEWLSRCIESRQLASLEGGGALSYTRTRGFWPVADRDSVVRSSVSIATDGRSARVRLESIDSPLAPEVDGVVRIPLLTAEYRLESEEGGGTRVEYRVSIDLGGRVPGFVESFVGDDMPGETLRNLRAQLARTRSEYADRAQAMRQGRPEVGTPTPSAN